MGFLNKEKVERIIIVKYQRPKLRNSNANNDIAITAVVMLERGDIFDACSFNLNFQLVQTLKCLQKF